jgi:hypothetical protein
MILGEGQALEGNAHERLALVVEIGDLEARLPELGVPADARQELVDRDQAG